MRRLLFWLLVQILVVTLLALFLSESSYLSFPQAFVVIFGISLLGTLTTAVTAYWMVKNNKQ